MSVCERCGEEISQQYGSGRFCSARCAHARNQTATTRKKIGDSLRGRQSQNVWVNPETACRIRQARREAFLDRNVYIRSHGKQLYLNITNRELQQYREQHPVCEMCGQKCKTGKQLAIDHDHNSGQFRGLLCCACNRKLGSYEAIKEQAEKYLCRSSIKAITAVL